MQEVEWNTELDYWNNYFYILFILNSFFFSFLLADDFNEARYMI